MIKPKEKCKMNSGDVLNHILTAQATRNLNTTALIQKAQRLPYCKRNILLALLLFWDKVYTDVTDILVNKKKESRREWNVNNQCLEYLQNMQAGHPRIIEFFFTYHAALTNVFVDKVRKELKNGKAYHLKFQYLADELSELMNLAYLALTGLRFDCVTLGGTPVCIDAKQQWFSDCGVTDDMFVVLITEEHLRCPQLLQETVDAIYPYFQSLKKPMIAILDYRNVGSSNYVFGEKARKRYEQVRQVFKAVYLYNINQAMRLSRVDGIEQYIIPDKNGLRLVKKNWQDSRKVTLFPN